MMNRLPLLDWLDNPIFVKHLRSRLRAQPLGAAMVVVLVLCICIAWGGYQLDAFHNGGAFGALLALQVVILIVMGASQVGSSVSAARASGILDFHRVSPLTPGELTIGFFFGAPIREYILFACTLPFSALCLAFGTPTVHGFIELMILLFASAWVFQGMALLNALVGKPRNNNSRMVVGVLFFAIIFGGPLAAGASRASALADTGGRLQFYGISLPWLAVVLLPISAALYFIYLAARRSMSSERIHPLSKPQAISALATAAVLAVGTIWRQEEYAVLEVGTLYLLVIMAIILTLMVTPSRSEYEKGLWRARKAARAHLPWWDDLALNRVFLLTLCAIVLVSASVASNGAGEPAAQSPEWGRLSGSFPLAIATGVLVVAYFGLAHQYFALRYGGRSKIFLGLFLFLVWLLPLVAGMIVAIAGTSPDSSAEKWAAILFSLSPVAGIGAIAAVGRSEPYSMAAGAAAITPALLFTFVFNSLLVEARRRIYRRFLAAATAAGKSVAAAPSVIPVGDNAPVGVKAVLDSV
jgi:hypothetical protein